MLRENQLDLILLETGEPTGLTSLGSKAEEVFRRSPVIDNWPFRARRPALETDIFSLNYMPDFLPAVPFAISFAEGNDAELTLLHVMKLGGSAKKKRGVNRAPKPCDTWLWLAGEIGFIHHSCALDHHSIRRTNLTRINHEGITNRNLRSGLFLSGVSGGQSKAQ